MDLDHDVGRRHDERPGALAHAQGLAFPGLVDVLADTLATVRDGDLHNAHAGFKVPGTSEAFFTKWLWVAALGSQARLPLILDSRVLVTLRRIHGSSWARPRGTRGYVEYVDAMS